MQRTANVHNGKRRELLSHGLCEMQYLKQSPARLLALTLNAKQMLALSLFLSHSALSKNVCRTATRIINLQRNSSISFLQVVSFGHGRMETADETNRSGKGTRCNG